MKRSIALAVVLFAAFSAIGQEADPAVGETVGVAFVGFDSGDISESGRLILSDLVRREISIAPGFSLVDRGDIELLLEEQELRLSEAFDASDPVRIGALTGAGSYIVGRIGLLGTLYIISLRMINVETGQVTRTVTEEFIGPLEDLRKPVRVAAQKILGVPGIEVNQGEFISIETDPPGVGVYVNGLFEGNGPVVIRVPKPGKYDVKLATDGYKPWSQNVNVEKNATFFLKARLIKQEKIVDERTRALQDGRVSFLTFTTVYAALASEATLYALGSDNVRLYVGLPLLTSPLAFFGALKATDGVVMNSGRSFMIMSSTMWGSTWGLVASFVFGADGAADAAADEEGSSSFGFLPLHAGLSVAGGLVYGGLSTWLTSGDEPFPSSRVWLYHLGSVLGSFLGLGVPYVFGAESPGVIYGGMLAGSLAGSATALWLTRDYTEGRNVGNVSFVPEPPWPVALGSDGGFGVYVPLLSARY